MSNINQVSNLQSTIATSISVKTSETVREEVQLNTNTSTEDVIYNVKSDESANPKNFKVDMEKVKNMKEETDKRMVDLLTKSITKGHLKQLGGLRGVLEKILSGEKIEGLDIEITDETIQKAKEDIAPGGYWSPEKTSDRFLEFAKALSGDDPSKANMLLDAFKKGYKEAEKIWGGELPEISKKTYELTLEKFEAWSNTGDSE
ncbi:MAG: hypothetical protein CVU84_01385 [Firmicutes bacterium HGW-Firmicutes-1]|nr:MAG: hypothetical protein CVU84_01385 [Firmicutes bacterium HGW-Firmicutes-1]